MTHVDRVRAAVAGMSSVFSLEAVTAKVNSDTSITDEGKSPLTTEQVSKAVRSVTYIQGIKRGWYRVKGRKTL